MDLANDTNSNWLLAAALDDEGHVALRVRPIAGGVGEPPTNINDLWSQMFVLDGDGNVAINVVAPDEVVATMSFEDLADGTNTTAAMVVGTGSSLTISGSGTINATSLLTKTWAAPAAIGSTTPAAGTFTTATVTTRTGTPAAFACFDSGGKLVESAVACL